EQDVGGGEGEAAVGGEAQAAGGAVGVDLLRLHRIGVERRRAHRDRFAGAARAVVVAAHLALVGERPAGAAVAAAVEAADVAGDEHQLRVVGRDGGGAQV